MKVYTGAFSDWHDVTSEFDIDCAEPTHVFASYDTDGYEGYAFVVFSNGEGWKFASGSHCSCYGLEGQWEPEDFSLDNYFAAKEKDKELLTVYDKQARDELHEFLLNFKKEAE